MTLVEFIKARLDEDEAAAQRAHDELTHHAEAFSAPDDPIDYQRAWAGFGRSAWTEREDVPISTHIARHDPVRVLAEVDAKRRLLALWERENGVRREHAEGEARAWLMDEVLQALALPYAHHPDYDEVWRP